MQSGIKYQASDSESIDSNSDSFDSDTNSSFGNSSSSSWGPAPVRSERRDRQRQYYNIPEEKENPPSQEPYVLASKRSKDRLPTFQPSHSASFDRVERPVVDLSGSSPVFDKDTSRTHQYKQNALSEKYAYKAAIGCREQPLSMDIEISSENKKNEVSTMRPASSVPSSPVSIEVASLTRDEIGADIITLKKCLDNTSKQTNQMRWVWVSHIRVRLYKANLFSHIQHDLMSTRVLQVRVIAYCGTFIDVSADTPRQN